ncbi:MAG: hypothetical protein ABSC41_07030 [Acidimicrobiales bacterium]|jgi:hypothetical protein
MRKSRQIQRIRRLSRLQGLHRRDLLPPTSPVLLPKKPGGRVRRAKPGTGADQ